MKPILRLDSPTDCSTRMVERLEICGWLGVPEKDEAVNNFRIRLLLEQVPHSEFGEILNGQLVEEHVGGVEISLGGRDLKGANVEGFRAYQIKGGVDVSKFVESAVATEIALCLVAESKTQILVSNKVRISLLPKREWQRPCGGFLSPDVSFVNSELLLVEGWVLRMGDRLSEVNLQWGDVNLGRAEIGFESGHFGLALPDPEDSKRCIFRALFQRNKVLAVARGRESDGERPGGSPLLARARFESGQEYSFVHSSFSWGRPAAVERMAGEIESVVLNSRGEIEVTGWVIAGSGAVVRIFIETWRKRIAVAERGELVEINWISRDDLRQKYFSSCLGSKFGFRLCIKPSVLLGLGRYPVGVLLCAEANGERLVFGQRELLSKLQELLFQWARVDPCYRAGIEIGLRTFSALGLRQSHRAKTVGSTSARGAEGQKRILFATHNLSATEGAPLVLLEIVREVRRRLPTGDLVLIAPSGGPLAEEFSQLGVEIKICPELSCFEQTWERYGESVKEQLDWARDFSPHLVFANVIDSFWAVDLARRLGVPSLWMVHESENPLACHVNLDFWLRMRFLDLLGYAKLLFVCEATAALFKDLAGGGYQVIPNGVDVGIWGEVKSAADLRKARERLGIEGEATVIAIIGTTTERKGQDIFLREMKLLVERRGEELKFFIVGARDIPFLERLKQMVVESNLESRVTLVPECPETRDYFVAADVVTICSRKESAPLVSLEAFAIGTPLVSTSVFGLAEQLSNERNALTFDVEKEGGLADAVARLMDDPLLGAKLVAEGRKDVEGKFSRQRMLEGHWAEIEPILAR